MLTVEIIDPPEYETVDWSNELAKKLNEQIKWASTCSSFKNWTIISTDGAPKKNVREVVSAAKERGYNVDPKYWWSIHTGHIKVGW